MALDYGLGLGFLVGSLALLGLVLYLTRIRGPSLPHETLAGGETEGDETEGGDRAAATDSVGPPPAETCELCGENPAVRTTSGLTVCAECDDDLLT